MGRVAGLLGVGVGGLLPKSWFHRVNTPKIEHRYFCVAYREKLKANQAVGLGVARSVGQQQRVTCVARARAMKRNLL